MTTHTWPAGRLFEPQLFTWGATERIGQSESVYTGSIGTGEVPFSYRYTCTVGWPGTNDAKLQQQRIAFLARIRRAHRVRIPNFAHREPAGTLRGTPTVTSTTAQGATTMTVTTSTAGHTVIAGDLLGFTTAIGTQVVTITVGATASGTALALTFEPPLRASVTSGTAVVWDAPAPLFIRASPDFSASFRPAEAEPLAVDFVEVW
jgi:hypothetical protein